MLAVSMAGQIAVSVPPIPITVAEGLNGGVIAKKMADV
jgi:hypothetical protein